MSDNAWETVVGPWREAYEKQAELTRKSWLDGQAQLASILTGGGSGDATDMAADVGAASELWRSWMELGGSLGHALPGFPAAEGVAADTLGHLTDPLSLSLVGGSQVGQMIRRMTEGPRFADIGANEHRAARLMELWMAGDPRADLDEGSNTGRQDLRTDDSDLAFFISKFAEGCQ